MLFKFNPAKMEIRYELVTAITEALGGSMRIVDQDIFNNEDRRMVTTRLPLPFAVARAVKKQNKNKSEFLVPVYMAIVTYEGVIVHIERATFDQHEQRLDSTSERAVRVIREKVQDVQKGNWYTDGTVIYQIPHTAFNLNENKTYLTSSKRFFAESVTAFKFTDMVDLKLIGLCHTRSIVGFIDKNRNVVFTPPLWTNVMDLRTKGSSGVKTTTDTKTDKPATTEPKDTTNYRFDLLNAEFSVNLEFILSSAAVIGEYFGYDQIEFLRLEDYMIDLRTVNLPKVSKSRRQTYNTGLQFVSCMAWLMGFIGKCNNLDTYSKLTAVMKILCRNGLFNTSQVEKTLNLKPPAMLTADQARNQVYTKLDSNILGHYWASHGKLKTRDIDSATFIVGDVE